MSGHAAIVVQVAREIGMIADSRGYPDEARSAEVSLDGDDGSVRIVCRNRWGAERRFSLPRDRLHSRFDCFDAWFPHGWEDPVH